jgi:hypothetical protein
MLSNFLQSRKAVASRSRLAVRLVAFLCLGFLAHAQTAHAQEPLTLFKNYFLTGDYTVRGKSLWRKGVNGKATVDIPPLGAGTDVVTPGADIVAADLYIQTAERVQGSGIDHARFAGIDLGPFYAPDQPTVAGSGTLAKALNWDQATVPCWSVLFPGEDVDS